MLILNDDGTVIENDTREKSYSNFDSKFKIIRKNCIMSRELKIK